MGFIAAGMIMKLMLLLNLCLGQQVMSLLLQSRTLSLLVLRKVLNLKLGLLVSMKFGLMMSLSLGLVGLVLGLFVGVSVELGLCVGFRLEKGARLVIYLGVGIALVEAVSE